MRPLMMELMGLGEGFDIHQRVRGTSRGEIRGVYELELSIHGSDRRLFVGEETGVSNRS